MPGSATDRSRWCAVLALTLAIVGGASMLYYHLALFVPRALEVNAERGLGNGYAFGSDFYPVWLCARMWRLRQIDPYSPEMTRQIQTGLFGRPLDPHIPSDPPVNYGKFAYPAQTLLLLWPAGFLDFPKLRLALAVLLPLLTAGGICFWLRALDWPVGIPWFAALVILSLCNYPVLEALFAEQPGLIVGVLLALAALALRRDRLFLAGVLTSLTLIKPQMTILATIYLLLWSMADRHRVRFLAGFLATSLTLLGASLWIWPRWIGEWLLVVVRYRGYATPPLVAFLLGKYVAPVATVVLLLAGGIVAWQGRRASPQSDDFWLALSLLLAISCIVLLPGQAIYDHIVLLPGIFLILRCRRALGATGPVARILMMLGAALLVWPWMAAFALIAVRPWLQPGLFYSPEVFALPLRTTAALPFAVLALLALAVRLARRGAAAV